MKTVPTSAIALMLATGFAFCAIADEKPAAKPAPKNSAFEKITSLNGEWTASRAPGEHGEHGGTVTYKVTAAGSVVHETLFAGTDHEMITMFYMEGDNLALTHYCMLQNRPHMRAEKQSSPDKIVFKCVDGEDPKLEAEDHMHQVTFTFVDPDHVKADWVLFKGGKSDSKHSFELTRKKK